MIFFLLPASEWEAADNDLVASPGPEGFVHCCAEGQIHAVRRTYFPADIDIVALRLDPTVLSAETRYEPGSGGEPQRFPHVYGAIPRTAVLEAYTVPVEHA